MAEQGELAAQGKSKKNEMFENSEGMDQIKYFKVRLGCLWFSRLSWHIIPIRAELNSKRQVLGMCR